MCEVKKFVLKENRNKINLNIYIIDFESVNNFKLFMGTISKILIANKIYKNSRLCSMVCFTGTYNKSRVLHEFLNKLFDLVEEKNTKTITGGSFGYTQRLKLFIEDSSKHLPAFESFLTDININVESLLSIVHKDIEELLTITSSRGVGKTGVSLQEKSLAIYRFDDLKPIVSRYCPISNKIENWRLPFESDFIQLAGRIACLGNSPETNLNRCAILARATKMSDDFNPNGSNDTVNWSECLKLLETIPSIGINNIYFSSYSGKSSIKDDPAYQNNKKYFGKIIESDINNLIDLIIKHIGLSNTSVNFSNVQSVKDNEPLTKEKQLKFKEIENKIYIQVKDLVNHLLKFNIPEDKINVIWGTNASHLFSGLKQKSIKSLINAEYKNLKSESLSDFSEKLLEKWCKEEIYPRNKEKLKRKRTKKISISVERTFFNALGPTFRGTFTPDETDLLKEFLKNKIPEWIF